jgi:hypothetical protein
LFKQYKQPEVTVRKRSVALVSIAAAAIVFSDGAAFAQGGAPTSSISGTVVDSGGAAVPGASIVVKNDAGAVFETVSNAQGVFSVPAVRAGTYTITVTLAGFKTALLADVRVLPGAPVSVKPVLEVGQMAETITVESSAELIDTQTATVSATLNADQLNRMPTPTRNALNALTFLPGVNTATTNRNSNVNGLPDSFMNIMLDGVSNNDQFLRSSDGFFASVTPRQDAIEAVTVTTAAGGAQIGGSGAINVNFETRSGTNRFSGSVYEYFRHPRLNSNYWFNERNGLPKNDVKIHQYGARAGGPIRIPGLYDGTGKAFFFVHYEQLRFPNSFTRTRTVLHPRAQQGVFRYDVGGVTREVNVLELAARNGHVATIDPTVQRLLEQINAGMRTTGTVNAHSDPLLNSYVWLSPGRLFEHQPTLRLDYNITDKHRLSASMQFIKAERDPDYLNNADVRFPGAPNFRLFTSKRPLYSISLRSSLSSRLVNELQGGITKGGASYFGNDASNGPQTFEDQGGYAIDFDTDIGLTNWFTSNTPSWRSSWTYSVRDTVHWQLDAHSLSFGAQALFVGAWENAKQIVPGIQLGFNNTNDPAAGLFTVANFPNATAAQLTDARALYGLLTGRVTSVTGQAALDPTTLRYVAFAPRRREGRMDTHSLFVQDSWRVSDTLTLNGGLRWEVQLPFTAVNDVMSTVTMEDVCGISGLGDGGTYSKCNFNKPGAAGGKATPEFRQLSAGTRGYKTDWNNLAPNVGIAWRPNVQAGVLRKLLGDPDRAVVRIGYSVAYDRVGMSDFTSQYGANPGSTLNLTRNESTGLVGPGESWPVLLRERQRLFNAPFPETPTFPIRARANRADNIDAIAPDVVVASAHTWTAGIQRAIGKNTAIDLRYVGTRGVDQWSELNYNHRNSMTLVENGFLDEFKRAMANLQANNQAGGSRAGSFAYFGPGTGTAPLPVYLAYLNGRTDATNTAAYTGGSNTWTNTTLAQRLISVAPDPQRAAADLDGNLTRRTNAAAAGLPANFFVVNPAVNELNVRDSGAYSDYHALQVELRRRMTRGFHLNLNYQFAVEGGSAFQGFKYGRVMNPAGNVRHALKTQWEWVLPVGKGKRYGGNMGGFLDALVGGWQFNGVGRIQMRRVNIENTDIGIGNVRLVGMSRKELQKLYKHDVRVDPATGLRTVFMLPEDVILNTRRAFSLSTTSITGYSALGVPEGRYLAPANNQQCIQLQEGDCAARTLMVNAPMFTRFDVGITKRFKVRGRTNFEVRLDVLNVLDNTNFNLVGFPDNNGRAPGPGAGIFQTTSAYTDSSNTFDPGGRLGQLMLRFNW